MTKTSELKVFFVLAAVTTLLSFCAPASQAADIDSFAVNETAYRQESPLEKHISELERLGTYYFCLEQYKQSKDCFERSFSIINQAVKAGDLPADYENLHEYAEMLAVVRRLAERKTGV